MLFRAPDTALMCREGMPIPALPDRTGGAMNQIIYIIGLIVVIVFIVGFFGLS